MVNGDLVYRQAQGDFASSLAALEAGNFFQATPGDILPGLVNGDLSIEERHPTGYLVLSSSRGFKILKPRLSSSGLRHFFATYSTLENSLYMGGIRVTEDFVDRFNSDFLSPDLLNRKMNSSEAVHAAHLCELFPSYEKRKELVDFLFAQLAEKGEDRGMALQSRFYDDTPLVRPLVIGSLTERFAIVGDFFNDCGATGYKLN